MMNPYLIGGLAGLQFIVLGLTYAKGRADCYQRHLKAEIEATTAAIKTRDEDQARQSEAATSDQIYLADEVARLRRLLNERNRPDGQDDRNCLLPDDADGLRDDYNAIFEKRLHPVTKPDVPE